MNLFTIFADHAIDPFIMGILKNLDGDVWTARALHTHQDAAELTLGPNFVPVTMEPTDLDCHEVRRIVTAMGRHDSMLLFLRDPNLNSEKNFIPTLALGAYCCGEQLTYDGTYQLASLWYMDSPGCLIDGKTHWSLAPGNIILPTQL